MKQNWRRVRLGDIADVQSGGTPLVSSKAFWGGEIPWYSSGELNEFYTEAPERHITEEGLNGSNAKLFPKGALLIGMYDTAALKMSILDRDAAFNQAIAGVKPNDRVDLAFIMHAINASKPSILNQRRGVRQKNLSLTKIKEIPLNIPPLPEQQRIVAILDEAFAGIATAAANAEKNRDHARELFQSTLQSVFTQRGEGWIKKCLKDVCEKITDGTHQTPTYHDEGIIFLSSRNVTSGKINWDKIKYIDAKQHIEMHKRVAPRLNDILLAKNGTTGVAAIVDRDITFDIYVSLALLRALDVIRPSFLLYFINSPVAKEQFNKRLKGSGVPNLHLQEIREVIVSFPISLDEQDYIVAKLDDLSTETKKLEALYQQKLTALDELKKSILHQAFSGAL